MKCAVSAKNRNWPFQLALNCSNKGHYNISQIAKHFHALHMPIPKLHKKNIRC